VISPGEKSLSAEPVSPSSAHKGSPTPPFTVNNPDHQNLSITANILTVNSQPSYGNVNRSNSAKNCKNIPKLFSHLGPYSQLSTVDFNNLFPNNPLTTLVYKRVDKKVKPVPTTLPEEYRIQRIRPNISPISSLVPLPTRPPDFTPTGRLSEDRMAKLALDKSKFLLPEELKLAKYILAMNNEALAFEGSERGTFKTEYFKPVIIPTIEHVPWAEKNIPIPPGILPKVIEQIKEKIRTGVYEPSSSSYRSKYFWVAKKDGKSIRIVHDLQPLNKVTIKNAGVPPITDFFLDDFAAQSCYTVLDLYVGYDHRLIAEQSRDLTTFQTPFGTFRLTALPMGWSNSVAIFQGDVAFIIEDEIPDTANVFIDDLGVKGPPTRYELPNGGYETIPANPGIRRFVWEHLNDVHRILHRLKFFGATISGYKLSLCVPEVSILGHICTYEGRLPDPSSIQKIQDWPIPRNLTEL
jgi:hypothetical protein